MPARIALTDFDITQALEQCGGHLAAAAEILKVSSKTLSRRLRANPELRQPPGHRIWRKALAGDAAIRSGSDPTMRGTNPWTRYINIMDWDAEEVDDHVEVLTPAQVAEVISYFRESALTVTLGKTGRRR